MEWPAAFALLLSFEALAFAQPAKPTTVAAMRRSAGTSTTKVVHPSRLVPEDRKSAHAFYKLISPDNPSELYASKMREDLLLKLRDLHANPKTRALLRRLTPFEQFAVAAYTTDDYKRINGALRGTDPGDAEKLRPYITLVASGLRKLPDFRGEVHRGISLDGADKRNPWAQPPSRAELLARYRVGATVRESQFLSTSIATTVQHFSELPTQFVIQSSHGKRIDFLSHADEGEVLFAPGTQFRVTAVDHDEARGSILIHMTEVDTDSRR